MKIVDDVRCWTRSSLMPCCGSNAAPCAEKFMEPRLCNVAGNSIYVVSTALHSSHQHRLLRYVGNSLSQPSPKHAFYNSACSSINQLHTSHEYLQQCCITVGRVVSEPVDKRTFAVFHKPCCIFLKHQIY